MRTCLARILTPQILKFILTFLFLGHYWLSHFGFILDHLIDLVFFALAGSKSLLLLEPVFLQLLSFLLHFTLLSINREQFTVFHP